MTALFEGVARRRAGLASPALKILLIFLLTAVFLLPLFLVYDVITEREGRYREVVAEVGSAWGAPQLVAGPILVVPYRARVTVQEGTTTRTAWEERSLQILPDSYRVTAKADPEQRRRGMYEAVVYTVDLDISGDFVLPETASIVGPDTAIDWSHATVAVGVADPRSIRDGAVLTWGDGPAIPFAPGLPPVLANLGDGMRAMVPAFAATAPGASMPFSFTLALNGSESLSFVPLGRENRTSVASPWPDPSFSGFVLPTRSEIAADGFTAAWELSYFGRGYPPVWTSLETEILWRIAGSAYGVRFYQPVDAYQQSERSAKYGVLFVVFTFVVFFLFETVGRMRIHVFQYALVGLSLCLFYLLLLSIAEQIGFAGAYAMGAAAVVAQIVLYCRPVLGSWKRSLVLGALLAILYSTLYALMQLEDLALLLGSIGLFLALSAVMWVTRRVDWYAAASLDGLDATVRGGAKPSAPAPT
jgi:inner membrane protein